MILQGGTDLANWDRRFTSGHGFCRARLRAGGGGRSWTRARGGRGCRGGAGSKHSKQNHRQNGLHLTILTLESARNSLQVPVLSFSQSEPGARMKKISVVGVGYVGLVTAACFSDLGNTVTALDVDKDRIAGLKQGRMPIYEPGLEELVARNVAAGRLHFTKSYKDALKDCEYIFICVGTPSGVDGEADLKYVEAAARSIAENMQAPLIVINKSTVPVGTGDFVAEIIAAAQPKPIEFWVVSCPEFLREGAAIADFMSPHRTVLGSLNREAADKVAQLHLPLRSPIVITDLRTAEMIKYASNAFLATKISFINEIADICESLGADVKEVAAGMGFDPRVGKQFLEAGLGYGGSCFPKDVKALAFMAEEMGHEPRVLNSVMEINDDRRRLIVDRVAELVGELHGATIGLLGRG